jgi:hypothetical protein
MPIGIKRATGALLATLALAAVPAAASARTTIAELRVEGGGKTLDPGTSYVTGTETVPTARESGCRADSGQFRIPDPTALGILGSAFEVNRGLRPLRVTEDEFGLRVCRLAGFVETDSPFTGWLYRVNHRSPAVGAALRKLGAGDEVLWYFANFGNNVNTGDELVVEAPARARPGSVTVRVFAFEFDGTRKAAADGTVVQGGEAPALTENGRATVTLAGGTARLRAKHHPDIPSAPVEVCVNADLGECAKRRGAEIVGTAGRERIPGTPGPDVIRARGGGDRVVVAGGGADRVLCGRGRDTAVIDGSDTARACEVKIRR